MPKTNKNRRGVMAKINTGCYCLALEYLDCATESHTPLTVGHFATLRQPTVAPRLLPVSLKLELSLAAKSYRVVVTSLHFSSCKFANNRRAKNSRLACLIAHRPAALRRCGAAAVTVLCRLVSRHCCGNRSFSAHFSIHFSCMPPLLLLCVQSHFEIVVSM